MSKDYEIKMDGDFYQFEGGAIRYTKTGKGRFDLIPGDIVAEVLETYMNDKENGFHSKNKLYCLQTALQGSYQQAICLITICQYMIDDDDWDTAFAQMIKDLTVHFEKGAEKYGERNCEKGIPLKSFIDSGLRHLTQWINCEKDEEHYISAIWNFVMALWTIKHYPERCESDTK